jgi:uncharacterized protein
VWAASRVSQACLATKPTGIYAVLATASASGAGPIVVTMQVVRPLVMVIAAIVASKLLKTDSTHQEEEIHYGHTRAAFAGKGI